MSDPETYSDSSALPLLVTAEWLSFVEALSPDNLEWAVLESASQAATAGFAGLEIPLPHAEPFAKTNGSTFWSGMAKQLRDESVPIRTIHGPTFSPLEVSTERAIEKLRFTADVAMACEAEVVVMHPTPHSHPHVTPIARRLLERDVKVCTAFAEMLSGPTRLAVENLPTYGTAHLERLMAEVTHERVGVCFDTGHWSVRPEGSLDRAIERFASRIIHWHLSDNDGWTDQHLPPGKGTIDWQRWSDALTTELLNRPMLVELSVPLMQHDRSAATHALEQWRAAYQSASAAIGNVFYPNRTAN